MGMVGASLDHLMSAIHSLNRNAYRPDLYRLYDCMLEIHQDHLALLDLSALEPTRFMTVLRGSRYASRIDRAANDARTLDGSADSMTLRAEIVNYLKAARGTFSNRRVSLLLRHSGGIQRYRKFLSLRWGSINAAFGRLIRT